MIIELAASLLVIGQCRQKKKISPMLPASAHELPSLPLASPSTHMLRLNRRRRLHNRQVTTQPDAVDHRHRLQMMCLHPSILLRRRPTPANYFPKGQTAIRAARSSPSSPRQSPSCSVLLELEARSDLAPSSPLA